MALTRIFKTKLAGLPSDAPNMIDHGFNLREVNMSELWKLVSPTRNMARPGDA